MSHLTFEILEQAALSVIDILKSIPEFAETNIAIIGGLAIWKLVPTFRTTQDVDFLVTIPGAPALVKQTLLNLPQSPFQDHELHVGMLKYTNPAGLLVEIDIVADWQLSYFPRSAIPIKTVRADCLPYVALTDLILLKIDSCSRRSKVENSIKDVKDTVILLDQVVENKQLTLNQEQRDIVHKGLPSVIKFSDRSETWLKNKLGI